MRVYLIVYACEPNQGGEHQVGWKVANELVKKCTLKVITRRSNQKLIEQYNDENIDFQFIENDAFIHFKPHGKFSYFYYLFWQFSVYLYLKRVVKKDDIVHYLTFGNLHLPHFLFLLKSKLILGPMGGGSIIDTKLMRQSSLKAKVKSNIHRFINFTVGINPIYYILFARSSKIILRTEETLKIIPKCFHKKCSVFLETGVDASAIDIVKKERKLRNIITTARIIDSKNIDQVIEVFKKLVELTSGSLELSIVGDGPMKSTLEKKYSSVENLQFLGKVPHEKIESLLRGSDLFIFCSIKEGGSHSLFEAAMNNCPIACYDISGMKEFPKANASIKITPSHNIDDNIRRLAEKIDKIFNTQSVDKLCENAIADLKENYDWQELGKRYIKIYEEIKKGN
ncbi:glycosyltransferase [bacterium]|nr:glycosyltransferase [bacterium]